LTAIKQKGLFEKIKN